MSTTSVATYTLLDRGTEVGQAAGVELGWAKYVIGSLVAVSVAVREVRRRRRTAGDPDGKRAE